MTLRSSPASPVAEADDVLAGHQAFTIAPLTCRWPQRRARGLVVFCHGLGSSGREYAALSRHWAGNGYLVIHPTFGDSIACVAAAEPGLGLDPAVDLGHWTTLPEVRARMFEILHDPARWMQRLAVVEAVLSALPEILDATIGVVSAPLPAAIAGHSFGAYTAQLLAGAEIDLPDGTSRRFHDPRFTAAILLSAQGRDQQGLREGSWDGITGPMLNVTGTRDGGAKGQDWHWKVEPYDLAPPGDKYLAVLEGADHYLGGFSDRSVARIVPAQQEAVKAITTAFLDATLAGNRTARAWLDGIGDSLGDCQLTFRHK